MPIFAECGGLTYLCRTLTMNGRQIAMAGVLPAEAAMHPRFQALGYIEGWGTGLSPLLPRDLGFRGHEFHYSSLTCDADARFAVQLSRGKGICEGRDGLTEHDTVGTYSHAYFTDAFADALLSGGRQWQKR
jgi:hydrogenobyrinic acid a,c-diamide synthase (glutamine-hydrolysing) (EC 6.3.5.9)/cobyrinate a,c-diamide synthase (EC 6.3.5.-)